MAYDANGAAGPHSPPERRESENERQRVAEELAGEDWDAMTEAVQDWLAEEAANYIVALAKGGDEAEAERGRMRRDCVQYLAWLMDEDRINDALDGEAITAAEDAGEP